jgi:hypothetical protein
LSCTARLHHRVPELGLQFQFGCPPVPVTCGGLITVHALGLALGLAILGGGEAGGEATVAGKVAIW